MLKRRVIPDNDTDRLVAQLQRGAPGHRARAATALGEVDDDTLEPLCAALQDPDRAVRDAAARSLGQLRDPRAIAPLIEALRETFAWKRPWFQWLAGLGVVAFAVVGELVVWLLIALILLIGAGLTILCLRSLEFGALGGLWEAGWKATSAVRTWFKIGDFLGFRKRQNEYCLTIADALVKIAEKSPSPQLREALPDLQAIAGDFVQQSGRTRDAARFSAERIAAITERLKNLPAPADAPPVDTSTLPRATVPTIETSGLPRAVGEEQRQSQGDAS